MNETDMTAPPNALDAERSVLGACLIDRRALDEAASLLEPRHFYQPAHQRIFQAITDLWTQEKPADTLTVSQLLIDRGQDDGAGWGYLSELVDRVPTTANTEHYAKIVYEKAIRRGLLYATNDIQRWAYDEACHIEDVLANCERRVLGISERRATDTRKATDAWTALAELLDKGEVGIPYHLRVMTEATNGGMRRNVFTLLGGPTGGGKTRWLVGLIRHLLALGRVQVFFSLEETYEEVLASLAALHMRINPSCLGKADPNDPFVIGPGTDEWEEMGRVIAEKWDPRLYVYDGGGWSVDDIGAMVRRIQRQHGRDIDLHIDYAALLDGRGGRTLEKMEGLATELQSLYATLGVRGVVLTQVTQEQAGGKAHARYGYDLECAAQTAYNIEPPGEESLSEKGGLVTLRNRKNRKGKKTGHCLNVTWNADLATFED